MTDLKEIDNKKYIKCDVHLTRTTQESKLGFLTEIGMKRGDLRLYDKPSPIILDSINVFLHITYPTKDVKIGDTILYNGNITNIIANDNMFYTLDNNQMISCSNTINKLVATTQPSFSFNNKISTAFLKVYVKQFISNNIKNVYVEVSNSNIKLNSNSEVSIRKYTEPTYTKEEVENKIKQALKLADITDIQKINNILTKTL